MPNAPIRILSREDILNCISMKTAIDLMRQVFIALAAGHATVPIRTHLHLDAQESEMLCMPAYLPGIARSGLKVVGMQPRNAAHGLPFIHAAVLLSDAETGQLLALMDGTFLTTLRTGAASGLATDLLAHPDALTAALWGTGAQAFHQLEALHCVRKLEKIWVYNRTAAHGQAFAQKMQALFPFEIQWTDDLRHLKTCDIISTVTRTTSPLFSLSDLKPGVHINGVGAYRPDMAELSPETVAAAIVVVDQTQACLKEAGDLIQAIAAGRFAETDIHGEIGAVAAGKRPGRTQASDITFFKSVGNAAQDLIVASHVYEQAQRTGVGTVCNW